MGIALVVHTRQKDDTETTPAVREGASELDTALV
jgi:hypothetical protein